LEDKRNLVELDVRTLVELDVRGYIILVGKGLYLAIDRDNGREVYDLLKNEKLLLSECKNLSNPCMESNRFPGVLRCIDIFTSTAVAGYVDLLSLLLRMRLITDVNQLDNKGNNAGHYAASIGSIKILKLFILQEIFRDSQLIYLKMETIYILILYKLSNFNCKPRINFRKNTIILSKKLVFQRNLKILQSFKN
jgi:hypothetical protein